MARKRRDNTTAASINIGDLVEPLGNGIRATITEVGQHPHCTEPHVLLRWQYPDDFSVNGNFRGQSSGRMFRPGEDITRWLG